MTEAPKRVFIEDEFGEGDEDQWQYGCWDIQRILGYQHEYVRADLLDAVQAENAKLRAILEEVRTHCQRVDCFRIRYPLAWNYFCNGKSK